MNKTCLVVRGKKQNDNRFRPCTPTPDKHWAYMLLDSYAEYNDEKRSVEYPEGIGIHWNEDNNDVISVKITPELWKNDEACFEHLMRFIRENELTYEFPCEMEACVKCEGHPSCISNEHATSEINDDNFSCESL